MTISKSAVAVVGLLLLISLIIGGVYFFLQKPSVTLPTQITKQDTGIINPKFKASKVSIGETSYLYVIEGKFTQELLSLNEMSRARFLIDGESTTEIMITFPSQSSNFSIGQKNTKGEMVWTNQPFSSIKPLISPTRVVQLRFLKSTNKIEDSAVIQMLDELVQAESIKPTYYSIQPDSIGFL